MRHAQGAASGDEAPRTKIRRCLQGHCYVYAAVGLSDKGRQWLRDESSTFLVAAAVSASSVRAADDVSANLVDALTRVRQRLAGHLPPYMVCSNETLRHLARNRPIDDDALLKIPGFGRVKVDKDGDGFLKCIRLHQT